MTKTTRAVCLWHMNLLAFCRIAYHFVHFLLTASIVGFVQNSLFLILRHSGIGVQCGGVHRQHHPETDGNLCKIYAYPPYFATFITVSTDILYPLHGSFNKT